MHREEWVESKQMNEKRGTYKRKENSHYTPESIPVAIIRKLIGDLPGPARERVQQVANEFRKSDDGGHSVDDMVDIYIDKEEQRPFTMKDVEKIFKELGLSEKETQAFSLFTLFDMTKPYIAEKLGVSENTVKTFILRGRKKLRALSPDFAKGVGAEKEEKKIPQEEVPQLTGGDRLYPGEPLFCEQEDFRLKEEELEEEKEFCRQYWGNPYDFEKMFEEMRLWHLKPRSTPQNCKECSRLPPPKTIELMMEYYKRVGGKIENPLPCELSHFFHRNFNSWMATKPKAPAHYPTVAKGEYSDGEED